MPIFNPSLFSTQIARKLSPQQPVKYTALPTPSEEERVTSSSQTPEQIQKSLRLQNTEPLWLRIALVGCLLLAFFLRVHGIRFGLPHLYYWDEPTVVNRAVRFGSGDLNPHFFYYPALYMYVLAGVSGLALIYGRLTGHYHSVQDFAAEYFVDPTRVYMAARLATACVGTLAVFLTYLVGKRFFNARVGLIGALFMAVAVQSGTHSHVAITDVPHATFILAAYLPLYNIMARGRLRDYIWAGILIGLGMATKYLAVLLVPTLLLAAWLHARQTNSADNAAVEAEPLSTKHTHRNTVKGIVLAFLAIGAAFFMGTPYNIINLRAFLTDFRAQMALSQGGQHGTSFGMFLLRILPSDFGTGIFVLALLGGALLLWQRKPAGWLFLTFPVIYFGFIGRYPLGFARYMIPEDPYVALLAAYALWQGYASLRGRLSQNAAASTGLSFVAMCAAVLLAWPPCYTMLRWDNLMANVIDTRTQALQWAEQNIPANTTVSIQSQYDRTFFNVPLITDRKIQKIEEEIPARGKLAQIRERALADLRKMPVYHEIPWDEKAESYGHLQQAGAAYVFISGSNDPLDPQLQQQLEASHLAKIEFVASTGLPEGMPVLPPPITVYKLR